METLFFVFYYTCVCGSSPLHNLCSTYTVPQYIVFPLLCSGCQESGVESVGSSGSP